MKKTIITIMALLTISEAAAAGQIFGDVDSTTYYQGGIEFLAGESIINGYPDGTYKPNQTLNRAEMLKIIAEGAKIYYNWAPEVFQAYEDDKCFSDVPAGQWYTKYVCYGKEQGWVIGYSDGTFKPSQTVTFVEGLKMTFKGFGLGYTETSQPWYKDSVEAAGEKNYIPPTITAFAAGFKRGEMGDMIARIIKDNEDALEEYLGDRAELNATYATIEAGLDVSAMETEELLTGDTAPDDADADAAAETDADATADDADAAAADDAADVPAGTTHTVNRTSTGFTPSTVTIKKGDTVKFVNQTETDIWPASNAHPSHTNYPNSGLAKCGSGEASTNFDACKSIGPDKSWEFIFAEVGTWKYHDHFSPSKEGTIVVEE